MSQTSSDIWKMRQRLDRWRPVKSRRSQRKRRRANPWPELPSERLTLSPLGCDRGGWDTAEPIPAVEPAPTQVAEASIPPENAAAIMLLDSWLSAETENHDEEWEGIKRTIEENRLSDRKLFSQ